MQRFLVLLYTCINIESIDINVGPVFNETFVNKSNILNVNKRSINKIWQILIDSRSTGILLLESISSINVRWSYAN